MTKILGIDLGVGSIGWAYILQNKDKESTIKNCGVRIIPMGNEQDDFEKGRAITINQKRRESRSIRRNNQRYKLRRKRLVEILKSNQIIPDKTLNKLSTSELYSRRARAVKAKLSLPEIGRIFLLINQKRGYKSNRKANTEDSVSSPLQAKRQLIKRSFKKSFWSYVYEVTEEELLEKDEIEIIKKIAAKDSKINLEETLETFANNQNKEENSYLGKINRHKSTLEKEEITIGEYLFRLYQENPTEPLKGKVFYRSDYVNEFNRIWETQKQYYPKIFTRKLKKEIGKWTIFYQRPLKSQKGRVSNCRFETHLKAMPKSSPLFQEFKIWQSINNLEIRTDEMKSIEISNDLKMSLFEKLNFSSKLSKNQIANVLRLENSRAYHFNTQEIQGNTTLFKLKSILDEVGYSQNQTTTNSGEWIQQQLQKSKENSVDVLCYKHQVDPDDQLIYRLWHLLYSVENPKHLSRILINKFGMNEAQAGQVSLISFSTDHSTLSAKVVRKLMPYLEHGLNYYEACQMEGYKHSDSETNEERAAKNLVTMLQAVKKGSLRSPVVEKILNHLVNLINDIIQSNDLGRPDEIRIELARHLKQNAKQRESTTKFNYQKNKEHEIIRKELEEKFGFRNPSRKTIEKYKLWNEFDKKSVYSNKTITHSDLFSPKIEVEHIIPRSCYFDDSFGNKVLSERSINQIKGAMTAYDFMKTQTPVKFNQYVATIKANKKISNKKRKYLLMESQDIPADFVDRQIRESQYIAKKAIELLQPVCRKVSSTTGGVTNFLASKWKLNDLLLEMNREKYENAGVLFKEDFQTSQGNTKSRTILKGKKYRDDHRHHALDAIVIGFTNQSIIHRLNNLSQNYVTQDELKAYELNGYNSKHFTIATKNFRNEVKKALSGILISYKSKQKVTTRSINKHKVKGGERKIPASTPRGMLHKETVYGRIKCRAKKGTKINSKLTAEIASKIVDENKKTIVLNRLKDYNNNPKLAFKGLKKNPLIDRNGKSFDEVLLWEDGYVVRKPIGPDFKQIDKVVDEGVKRILKDRLSQFKNNPKLAFSNLEEHPIWLNKKAKIKIKRVRIKEGFKELVPLHSNKKGEPIDFVNLRSNHHAAIYQDEEGKLYEEVVSFLEALHRKLDNQPVHRQENSEGYKLIMTLHINEMVLFKSQNLDLGILNDLENKENNAKLSPYLYRVQSVSKRDYFFRHHLAAKQDDKSEGIRVQTVKNLKSFIKVKINRLGKVEKIGII